MLVTLSARPAAVMAGLFLFCAPAAAQGTAQERSACMGDAFRFCGFDIPDVPKIEACLNSKKDQLSPACRAEFKPSRAKKTKLKPEHFL
jgi:hypothetical protein